MAVTNKNRDLTLTIKGKNEFSKTVGTAIHDLKRFADVAEKAAKVPQVPLTKFQQTWKSLSSTIKTVGGSFANVSSGMVSGLGKVFDAVFSVKTLIMGLFAGILGKGIMAFINLNAEFEKMKVTMDVLTKGQGEVWFNKLNQWAL